MRLHFTIGGYDDLRTARLRQSIHFSFTQVLFADHVHWRSGVHNKFSFPQVSNVDAGRHLFSGDEKNAAFSCSFNLNTLLASFHAASRAPCSCHSVSSWGPILKFWSVGAALMKFHLGKYIRSEGFWSRILVWRAKAFLNFTRWIVFGMSVLFRRIDFGGVMSWNTQPNCRASDNWRFDEFCPNFLSPFFPGFPGPIVTSIGDRFSFLPISLFQHSHSTFVIIRFRPFCRLWRQPDDVQKSTFSQTDNHPWSCRTSILEGAIFHRMSCLQVPLR